MGTFRTSRTFDVVFVAALLGLLSWSYVQRIAIGDWLFFATHQPSAKAKLVADRVGLSDTGRRLFYRTDPQFVSDRVIAEQCDVEQLGCLTPQGQVFILDDPSRPNQTLVTAAHEMLHLAYRRLSPERRQHLAPLLDEAINQNATRGIQAELQNQAALADRRDEAHSLLGSEYTQLPAELEDYYRTYFQDRSRVVAAETASLHEP